MIGKAKLSGSLLAHRNARLAIEQEQSRGAPSRISVDQSFALSVGVSTLPSLIEKERQRRVIAISAGLAFGGVAIAAMLGVVFMTHSPEHVEQSTAPLNSNPLSQSAPERRQNNAGPEGMTGPQATVANSAQLPVSAAPTTVSPPTTVSMSTTSSAPSTTLVAATPAAVADRQPAVSTETSSPHPDPVTNAPAAPPERQFADTPSSVIARPSLKEVSALRARGDALFGSADIASARLFYERAAEGGDARAALQLGETYDPAFLKRAGINGIRGDSTAAKRWYQRASDLGASEAQILLKRTADR